MTTEMQNQLLARLDGLANKLGVAASYIFSLYVKQAYIDGIMCSIVAIICSCISFYLAKNLAPKMLERKLKTYEDNVAGFFSVFGAIATAVLSIMFLCFALCNLINPQYTAFKDVLSSIK